MKGWSEEEWLLGHDDYSLDVYFSYYGDFAGNSSDKNVHHKHTKMNKT